MNKKKVITLCGSLKLAQDIFNDTQMLLERSGHCCFSVGSSERDYSHPTNTEKETLDKVHYRKISMSDCVLVLDINGHIGNSTRNEITYADVIGKPVFYLRDTGYFNNKSLLVEFMDHQ